MESTDDKAPDVIVTVGSDGKPVCTPHTVRPQGRNAVLKFKLQTSGYAFPTSDAVVVANGGAEFPQPSQTVAPTVALLRDVNDDTATYSYTVTVQRVADGVLLRVDPTIQNGDK